MPKITTEAEFAVSRAECVERGKLAEHNFVDRFCTTGRMCGHHTLIAEEFLLIAAKLKIAAFKAQQAQENADARALDALTLEEKLVAFRAVLQHRAEQRAKA